MGAKWVFHKKFPFSPLILRKCIFNVKYRNYLNSLLSEAFVTVLCCVLQFNNFFLSKHEETSVKLMVTRNICIT